jgi:hypothetical protein
MMLFQNEQLDVALVISRNTNATIFSTEVLVARQIIHHDYKLKADSDLSAAVVS